MKSAAVKVLFILSILFLVGVSLYQDHVIARQRVVIRVLQDELNNPVRGRFYF